MHRRRTTRDTRSKSTSRRESGCLMNCSIPVNHIMRIGSRRIESRGSRTTLRASFRRTGMLSFSMVGARGAYTVLSTACSGAELRDLVSMGYRGRETLAQMSVVFGAQANPSLPFWTRDPDLAPERRLAAQATQVADVLSTYNNHADGGQPRTDDGRQRNTCQPGAKRPAGSLSTVRAASARLPLPPSRPKQAARITKRISAVDFRIYPYGMLHSLPMT